MFGFQFMLSDMSNLCNSKVNEPQTQIFRRLL